jgi:hypothetical protein
MSQPPASLVIQPDRAYVICAWYYIFENAQQNKPTTSPAINITITTTPATNNKNNSTNNKDIETTNHDDIALLSSSIAYKKIGQMVKMFLTHRWDFNFD